MIKEIELFFDKFEKKELNLNVQRIDEKCLSFDEKRENEHIQIEVTDEHKLLYYSKNQIVFDLEIVYNTFGEIILIVFKSDDIYFETNSKDIIEQHNLSPDFENMMVGFLIEIGIM